MGSDFEFNHKTIMLYLLTLLLIGMVTYLYLNLNEKQLVATLILFALVLGTVFFWEIRLSFALVGIAILIASGLLSIEKFIEFSSLNIILFLAGMMIFVGYLEKVAFFEYLISKLIILIGKGGIRLYVLLMFMAAFFAAIVDEVTSILFMLSIVLLITSKLRVNPVPFVLMIVFATNIGSSATAIGNPVGVMIALSAKLTFLDFLYHATIVSLIVLIATIITCYLLFRKELQEFSNNYSTLRPEDLVDVHQYDKRIGYTAIFFVTVFLSLVFHSPIENFLGLEKNSMLLGTSLFAAGIVLFIEGKNARTFVESKVDWWTLLFFMLLFSSVGTLEESGVMELVSSKFVSIFGTSKELAMSGIMLISGFLTAVLDNVLAVAVFIPLVKELLETPVGSNYLWWSLLFGSTLFGNLTIIGSTANIIAIGLMEKRGYKKITFMEWFRYGLPVVVVSVSLAFLLIYLQYLYGW
ncbi:MAG: SLC13 family permease [Candidatus Micrarchaeota archaeon]|nr:SLC13 family permease [Candidatus Micrarchaeota archaeon]